METLKQKWAKALRNPFYILLWIVIIALAVFVVTSCQPKNCPTYAKNNIETKNI